MSEQYHEWEIVEGSPEAGDLTRRMKVPDGYLYQVFVWPEIKATTLPAWPEGKALPPSVTMAFVPYKA